MSASGRSFACSYGGVEFLSARTRHEELMPAGTVLHAHVVRLAVGSRLQKHARALAARIFCENTNSQKTRRRTDSTKCNNIQEGQLPQTESAHLTWLYGTVAVQKTFQSETRLGVDRECDKEVRTAVPSVESV